MSPTFALFLGVILGSFGALALVALTFEWGSRGDDGLASLDADHESGWSGSDIDALVIATREERQGQVVNVTDEYGVTYGPLEKFGPVERPERLRDVTNVVPIQRHPGGAS